MPAPAFPAKEQRRLRKATRSGAHRRTRAGEVPAGKHRPTIPGGREESARRRVPAVLIAGCGDVGSELARRLLADGHDVYGLRRRTRLLPEGVRPVAGDLRDPRSLRTLPGGIDVVYYTASADRRSPEAYREVYVDGLRNVLSAVSRTSAVRRVLYTSSTRVYPHNGGERVDEDSPTGGDDIYARLLLEGERVARESSSSAVVVRFGGIYGPGRTRLIDLVRKGGPAPRCTTRIGSTATTALACCATWRNSGALHRCTSPRITKRPRSAQSWTGLRNDSGCLRPFAGTDLRRPPASDATTPASSQAATRSSTRASGRAMARLSRGSVLQAGAHPVAQGLSGDEPRHVLHHQVQGTRRVVVGVVGRAVRGDDQVGGLPQRRVFGRGSGSKTSSTALISRRSSFSRSAS